MPGELAQAASSIAMATQTPTAAPSRRMFRSLPQDGRSYTKMKDGPHAQRRLASRWKMKHAETRRRGGEPVSISSDGPHAKRRLQDDGPWRGAPGGGALVSGGRVGAGGDDVGA